jgi:RHS repeat-associated protein
VSYSYFSTGQREVLTYPDAPAGGSAKVGYSYDQTGAMASLTDWYGKTITFSHDPDGNTTATAYPDGAGVSDSFDLAGSMTALTATASDASVAAGISYGLDSAEKVSAETGTGALSSALSYSYDAADRLGSVAKGASAPASAAYDPAGNPTTLATGATQAFGPAGELTSATQASGAKVAYTYNPSGDRTTASATAPSGTTTSAYGYNQADMMTSASVPGASPSSYSYDGNGLLASVSSPAGVNADTWDMAAGLALLLSDATNDYLYGPTGTPVEQAGLASANVQYFVSDDQGSTRAPLGASGSLDATFSYDAYGKLASSNGTASTPLLYDGQYLDPTTGFYYLRARWYDPGTATFTSVDPMVSQTGQAYAYAGDDPVNGSDPSGETSQGGPPAPTSSATSYDYTFDLGLIIDPTTVANFVHDDCVNVFPIRGCDDNFVEGEHMLLQETLLFGAYTQSFPVDVKTVATTYFSFVALPGHPEGQGRQITFSFTQATSCADAYLHVYTSKQGSALTQWPGVRTLDFWIARQTWAELASNINKLYGWWAEKNYPSPPVLA